MSLRLLNAFAHPSRITHCASLCCSSIPCADAHHPLAVFNFQTPQHGVAQLPNAAAYEACEKPKAITLFAPDSKEPTPYKLALKDAKYADKVLYFACPVANHCQQGQKVQVNVGAPSTARLVEARGMMMRAAAPAPGALMGGEAAEEAQEKR